MKFRTEYIPQKSRLILNPENPVVLAGSCFSQNIASKMASCAWTAINPCGTLYNPESIALAIDMMADLEKGVERFKNSLFLFNGIWNSDRFDTSFSSLRRDDCEAEFINRQKAFNETLHKGKTLIVTFGTSIIYGRTETGSTVGNCHKQPSELFFEQRLTVSEIFSFWDTLNNSLTEKFPGLQIIFTVSPVRHLKNGFTVNSRSKAILQLGIEEICRYNENCFYFPAYEILNDDLRDYRFYATDLLHPSEEAVEYVWGKFCDTYLDENGRRLLEEGDKKVKTASHRPRLGALGRELQQ